MFIRQYYVHKKVQNRCISKWLKIWIQLIEETIFVLQLHGILAIKGSAWRDGNPSKDGSNSRSDRNPSKGGNYSRKHQVCKLKAQAGSKLTWCFRILGTARGLTELPTELSRQGSFGFPILLSYGLMYFV